MLQPRVRAIALAPPTPGQGIVVDTNTVGESEIEQLKAANLIIDDQGWIFNREEVERLHKERKRLASLVFRKEERLKIEKTGDDVSVSLKGHPRHIENGRESVVILAYLLSDVGLDVGDILEVRHDEESTLAFIVRHASEDDVNKHYQRFCEPKPT
ncbi:MAG TPA: hypothetical protein VNH11_06990 [Pirellulales bacterium]|nr:hypothetical protein [Pirellulales bacterium]